jgi:hypothetical protein
VCPSPTGFRILPLTAYLMEPPGTRPSFRTAASRYSVASLVEVLQPEWLLRLPLENRSW